MSTPLETTDAPLCFEVAGADGTDFETPTPRLGQAQRARIRTLSGMQKEALVSNSLSGKTWRLASDEGPYLDGADVAPPPLAFMTTGMVSAYANEVLALAGTRDLELRDIAVVLDNYYTISGSALQGTMTGEALSPDVKVTVDADADEERVRELVETATESSPVHGLLSGKHTSLFKLALNGDEVSTDRVAELDGPMLADPRDAFENLSPGTEPAVQPLIRHTGRETEPFPDADEAYTDKNAEGYSSEQDRMIHVRGTCTLREDGVKRIEQELYSPRGSIFEFHSDEPEGHGGQGRAPDAATYLAAGIGFCFLTQFGRYTEIVDEVPDGYRLVQDTHLSTGGTGSGTPGGAEPVETHLFVDASADEEFAREALDMSEQTCYLHALCRTDLQPNVEVTVR